MARAPTVRACFSPPPCRRRQLRVQRPLLHLRAAGPHFRSPTTWRRWPGRRLVTASETNEGVRLNEGPTQGPHRRRPVTARFLHGEFFTYRPGRQVLAGGQPPATRDGRLLRLLAQSAPDPVPADSSRGGPRTRTRASPPGRGLAGHPGLGGPVRSPGTSAGLEPPTAVLNATESYRTESDPLAQFLQESASWRTAASPPPLPPTRPTRLGR